MVALKPAKPPGTNKTPVRFLGPNAKSGATLPAVPPEVFSEEKNYTKRAPGATFRLPLSLSIVNSDAVYATAAVKMRVEVQ